jgi:hypothetical protein
LSDPSRDQSNCRPEVALDSTWDYLIHHRACIGQSGSDGAKNLPHDIFSGPSIEPSDLLEVPTILRGSLSNAGESDIRKDVAHRDVESGRSTFSPRCEGSGDGAGRTTQLSSFFDATPSLIGVSLTS